MLGQWRGFLGQDLSTGALKTNKSLLERGSHHEKCSRLYHKKCGSSCIRSCTRWGCWRQCGGPLPQCLVLEPPCQSPSVRFQVYSGQAPNFVLWNDQFYDDPDPDITPPCVKYCAKPWGHRALAALATSSGLSRLGEFWVDRWETYEMWDRRVSVYYHVLTGAYAAQTASIKTRQGKGLLAWDDDGTGFVLQVTTPDWPGKAKTPLLSPRQSRQLGTEKTCEHMPVAFLHITKASLS